MPAPLGATKTFQRTQPSTLMDQDLKDLLQHGILEEGEITFAFRCFLIAEPRGAARLIVDELCTTLPVRLCTAAEMLRTLQTTGCFLRMYCLSGLYQIRIKSHDRRHHGVHYTGVRWGWGKRLRVGPLPPWPVYSCSGNLSRRLGVFWAEFPTTTHCSSIYRSLSYYQQREFGPSSEPGTHLLRTQHQHSGKNCATYTGLPTEVVELGLSRVAINRSKPEKTVG